MRLFMKILNFSKSNNSFTLINLIYMNFSLLKIRKLYYDVIYILWY